MEAKDVLDLVKAGFSKEEIMILANSSRQPEAAPEEEPQPKEEPKPEKAPEEKPEETAKEVKAAAEKFFAAPVADPQEAVNAAVKEALKPFEDLYDHMAKLAGMPSIDSVQPKSIDDIVDNFFKGE